MYGNMAAAIFPEIWDIHKHIISPFTVIYQFRTGSTRRGATTDGHRIISGSTFAVRLWVHPFKANVFNYGQSCHPILMVDDIYANWALDKAAARNQTIVLIVRIEAIIRREVVKSSYPLLFLELQIFDFNTGSSKYTSSPVFE